MSITKKLVTSIISGLILFSLFISIFPWSISPFLNRIIRQDYSNKTNISVIPIYLDNFSKDIGRIIPFDSSVAFISKDRSGEEAFFLLSSLLFPRRIYWINDKTKGPISWWHKVEFTPDSLKTFFELYHIRWMISYTKDEFDIKEYAEQVIQNEPFILWERK